MNIVHGIVTLSYYDFLWYGKTAWTLFMGLWMPLSYMKVMNIDHARSLFIATSMKSDRYEQWSWLEAMNIDRYDHCSYWFMHECAVHAMKGYWSCMKNVDHSYEQALIMHDNVHIHVIMNIIVTPTAKAPPQYPKWPKMDIGVIIWGIFLHVNFLYNFWEFLHFFPDL